MSTFRTLLESSGMAPTRASSLSITLSNLHTSVSQMDRHNLRLLKKEYPAILQAVQIYAQNESGLNRFED